MFFKWLKNFLPQSLYGRAALIMLVPIVSIQLVVSVVFIQRHFNSITEQMTGALAAEIAYLSAQVNLAGGVEQAREIIQVLAPALALDIVFPAAAEIIDSKRFDDLTGALVTRVLYQRVPGLSGVDLSFRSQVMLGVETNQGRMQLSFGRARLSATNPHQLLVLMVLFSILMTVISFFFLRNQLRPIKRLARAADAFGKGQILRYDLAGSTEVRAAGRSFLDMRARIEHHIEQRTLMLSGVSHDLRTPLTRLKLGLEMLDASSDRDALMGDVNDMERLLNEFLDFARINAQDGDTTLVNPHDLLTDLVQKSNRVGQVVHLGEMTACDQVRLRLIPIIRALENLLSNAARYASQARVGFSVHDQHIIFAVEDDGPGIAPKDRAEALRPFTRLDKARNQDKGGGVGLGLAIAADIARAHGGHLILGDSKDLGGLKVELILPL